MNINMVYWGGSGGYFLLHLLLLSDIPFCCLPVSSSKHNFLKQWHTDYPNWKSTELEPINWHTLESNADNKIFFTCNPRDTTWLSYPGTKVQMYAQDSIRIQMATLKKAYLCDKRPVLPVDCVIDLQALCKYPANELSKLGISINKNQSKFVKFWIDLHPQYIKDLLLTA